MNYDVCVNCKHYNHNVIERGSARYAEPFCALDKTQVVYLFTTCKIGKWEAKDESDSDLDKNGIAP